MASSPSSTSLAVRGSISLTWVAPVTITQRGLPSILREAPESPATRSPPTFLRHLPCSPPWLGIQRSFQDHFYRLVVARIRRGPAQSSPQYRHRPGFQHPSDGGHRRWVVSEF